MKETVNKCIGCGMIGKKDNTLLTVMKGTLGEFYVCNTCFHKAHNDLAGKVVREVLNMAKKGE